MVGVLRAPGDAIVDIWGAIDHEAIYLLRNTYNCASVFIFFFLLSVVTFKRLACSIISNLRFIVRHLVIGSLPQYTSLRPKTCCLILLYTTAHIGEPCQERPCLPTPMLIRPQSPLSLSKRLHSRRITQTYFFYSLKAQLEIRNPKGIDQMTKFYYSRTSLLRFSRDQQFLSQE